MTGVADYAVENNCFGREQRAGLGMEKELDSFYYDS